LALNIETAKVQILPETTSGVPGWVAATKLEDFLEEVISGV
jgi:hypothetical protein